MRWYVFLNCWFFLILYLKVLLIFFFNFIRFIHFIYFAWNYTCAPYMCLVPWEVRREYQIPWKWIISICTTMWVLEFEAWPPARATSTLYLNLWAVSQFLFQILLTCRSSLLYFNQYTSSTSVTQWCFLIFLEFVIANVCVSICNWDCSANSWISLSLSVV